MHSIYLHIPFCKSKCPYCDFLSIRYNEDIVKRYIFSIKKEIKIYSQYFKKIKTIYFGGGTPSILKSEHIAEILNCIYKNFDVEKKAEITIETNPETLNYEKLKFLHNIGINRLSIGAQSLNCKLLKILGRKHTKNNIVKNFQNARNVGFENINIDLIFGIPTQNEINWEKDLNCILSLSPDHISIYSLTIKDNTKFGILYKKNIIKLPSDNVCANMYKIAIDMFKNAGLAQYEISNFAKKDKICLHNFSCWHMLEYIGLGVSSVSYIHNMRYQNICNIKNYIKKLKENILPISYVDLIDEKNKIKEKIMLSLRLKDGLNLKEVGDNFLDKDVINKLKKEKLIRITKTHLKPTTRGMFLSNYVILNLWQN